VITGTEFFGATRLPAGFLLSFLSTLKSVGFSLQSGLGHLGNN